MPLREFDAAITVIDAANARDISIECRIAEAAVPEKEATNGMRA